MSPEFCFLVCLGRAVSRHEQNRVGLEETKGPLSVPSEVERVHPIPLEATGIELDRTSVVAQWLRIRLPMQGTRVRALVREDPTCRGVTKPVHHNY